MAANEDRMRLVAVALWCVGLLVALSEGQLLADIEECPLSVDASTAGLVQGPGVLTGNLPLFARGIGGRAASCRTFPSDSDTYCSKFLGGEQHYMPDATPPSAGEPASDDYLDFLATEEMIGVQLLPMEADGLPLDADSCQFQFYAFSCLTRYPPCEDEQPMRLSTAVCTEVRLECALVIQGAELYSGTKPVSLCFEPMTETDPQYFFRPDNWTDTGLATFISLGFSEPALQATAAKGRLARETAALEASLCQFPMITVTDPLTNSTFCDFECEHPLYSQSEWALMRNALVVPGLVSIPFNLVALWRATRTIRTNWLSGGGGTAKAARTSINWLFLLTIVMALLFALLSAVPAAALHNEVGCGSAEAAVATDGVACWLSKTSPFVLLSFLLCVDATLLRIFVRTRAARRMKLYESSHNEGGWVLLVCFLLPAALMATAFLLDDPRLVVDGEVQTHQYRWNIRNSFLCFPRIKSVAVELALMHVPLLLAGVAGFVLAMRITVSLKGGSCASFCGLLVGRDGVRTRDFNEHDDFYASSHVSTSEDDSGSRNPPHRGSGSSLSGNGNGHSAGSRSGSTTGDSRTVGSFIFRTKRSRERTQRLHTVNSVTNRVAASMLRFAIVMLAFIILANAATLSFFPRLSEFEANYYLWRDCITSDGDLQCLNSNAAAFGANVDECCRRCDLDGFSIAYAGVCADCDAAPSTAELFGEARDELAVPSVASFTVFYLSWSVLPLLFGILFSSSEFSSCWQAARSRRGYGNDRAHDYSDYNTDRGTGSASTRKTMRHVKAAFGRAAGRGKYTPPTSKASNSISDLSSSSAGRRPSDGSFADSNVFKAANRRESKGKPEDESKAKRQSIKAKRESKFSRKSMSQQSASERVDIFDPGFSIPMPALPRGEPPRPPPSSVASDSAPGLLPPPGML